ncbi:MULTISPECIES: SMI1/KNR4 family protein [unclassified Micromonospora]|uniref:SMI1/KNR4 family protein n=1 Tax=unclassified Micromonospora TaxID=2617518 RepID=UPI001C605570|nr:SMI1/KNR4 family protein [Micromonospora sp. RL09-050-HVF-A]MBW4702767.1 SMI1/KNR4 family protein [Micromonospora sp. RL09-050-HVF-A]
MTRPDWSDVRGRLALLAAAPGAGAVFGAADHGWQLELPLTTEELAQAEAQFQVELPAEYRSFLLEAGRGGAGPAYGLFPMRRLDGRWQWEGDGADLTTPEALGRPFAHVAAFNPADGLPAHPDEDDYDSQEAFTAAQDAYEEQYERLVFTPEHSMGLLYLCHLGCALREALVVSGPARGRMWADDIAEGGGFRPLHDDDGTPLGFARWYRRWLAAAEAQVATGSAPA